MMPDDIITRDSEGQLAVNTVSSTEANVPYNYDDCFTIDTNGRRALRVVGGGGGAGAVTSVNGQTGDVVLDAEDVGAQEATNIVEIDTTTVVQALADNTIYNCGEMTSIEITFPANPTIEYIAQLNFTSGTTPTAFTSPAGMKWVGDDVSTTFVPAASKRYAIMFFWDGQSIRGIVQAA